MQKLIDKIEDVRKERTLYISNIEFNLSRIKNKVSKLEEILDTIDFMSRPKPTFSWHENLEKHLIHAPLFVEFVRAKLAKSSVFELKQINNQVANFTDATIENIYYHSIG